MLGFLLSFLCLLTRLAISPIVAIGGTTEKSGIAFRFGKGESQTETCLVLRVQQAPRSLRIFGATPKTSDAHNASTHVCPDTYSFKGLNY